MNVDEEIEKLDGVPHSKREIVKSLLHKALANLNDEPLKLEIIQLKSKIAMLEEALKMKELITEAVQAREEEFVQAKKSKKKVN